MKNDERESLQEAKAEYREWENSLEGVAYWLGDLPFGESLETVTIQAVHRLPDAVREFVYCHCRFASAGDAGVTIRCVPEAGRPWLIALGQGDVEEGLIAHEIAHAWLGHECDPQAGELRLTQQDEEAACDLTRQWGFGGTGTEIVHRPH